MESAIVGMGMTVPLSVWGLMWVNGGHSRCCLLSPGLTEVKPCQVCRCLAAADSATSSLLRIPTDAVIQYISACVRALLNPIMDSRNASVHHLPVSTKSTVGFWAQRRQLYAERFIIAVGRRLISDSAISRLCWRLVVKPVAAVGGKTSW